MYQRIDRLPTYPLPRVILARQQRAGRRQAALVRWTLLFLALNIVDGVETWFGLRAGIPERLPVYRWLFAHESFAVAMLFKAFVILWLAAFVVHTRTRWPWPGFAALLMRVLCAVTTVAVIANGVSLYLRWR
jgi:hypothetical protein